MHVAKQDVDLACREGALSTLIAHEPVPDRPGFESRIYLIEYPPAVAGKLHVHAEPSNVLERGSSTDRANRTTSETPTRPGRCDSSWGEPSAKMSRCFGR